jgi:hypothetical protein
MPALGAPGIIVLMALIPSSPKPGLVADMRPAVPERGSPRLRRYRISRLRLEGRLADPAHRFEHLKRVYD